MNFPDNFLYELASILLNIYTKIRLILFSGKCLYLVKSVSLLNGYNCKHFKNGCPSTSYVSYEIYKCKYHGELTQLYII